MKCLFPPHSLVRSHIEQSVFEQVRCKHLPKYQNFICRNSNLAVTSKEPNFLTQSSSVSSKNQSKSILHLNFLLFQLKCKFSSTFSPVIFRPTKSSSMFKALSSQKVNLSSNFNLSFSVCIQHHSFIEHL